MKIVFLGRLADAAGHREFEFALPPGITDTTALRDLLGKDIPALVDPSVRIIVNDVVARDGHPLAPGDEVAFFPPVSGG